jgi:hypothetical protein
MSYQHPQRQERPVDDHPLLLDASRSSSSIGSWQYLAHQAWDKKRMADGVESILFRPQVVAYHIISYNKVPRIGTIGLQMDKSSHTLFIHDINIY